MMNNNATYFILFFGDKPPDCFESNVARYAGNIGLSYQLEKKDVASTKIVKANLGVSPNASDISFTEGALTEKNNHDVHRVHWDATSSEWTIYWSNKCITHDVEKDG